MNLRLYQHQAIEALRQQYRSGARRVLFVLPTGGGKTVVFSHIAQHARGRVLVLVHRVELLEQASRSLLALGVPHGMIRAGQPVDLSERVQVASVQTVARRLRQIPPDWFSLAIVDEAHHTNAGTWARVLEHLSSAHVLGVTATPVRTDGRGLGEHYERMVPGPSPAWLVEEGFLARARVFAPPIGFDARKLRVRAGDFAMDDAAVQLSQRAAMGDVVQHYRRHLAGQTAIAFCCSVAHAEAVAERFVSEGISASSIDGTMSTDRRRELLEQLDAGELKVLTSCQLIGEGVDVPSVGGCILLRPTQSEALHLQMIGRCLRPQAGKVAVVLDHVGNVQRLGHHLEEREWTLDGVRKRAGDGAPSCKVCKACFATMPSGTQVCPECGAVQVEPVRELKELKGELVEVTGWRGSAYKIKPGDSIYTVSNNKRISGPHIVKRFTNCYVVCHATKQNDDKAEWYFHNSEVWIPPFKKGDSVMKKDHKTGEWESGWKIATYIIEKQSAFLILSSKYDELKDYKPELCGDLRYIKDGNFKLDTQEAAESHRSEQARAQTLEDLIAVGQRRGMNNPRGWARHVLAARQAKGHRSYA